MDVNPIRQRFQVAQNEVLPNGYPRFLFRGQSKDYNSLNTTIGRLYATDSNAAYQAHMLYRQADKVATAMEGYRVQKLDALALLQHYGWPTPLLDFSSSLEVAIWFALFDATPSDDCLIYVLDLKSIPEDLVVFQDRENEIIASWQISDAKNRILILDHFFLTHPLHAGGIKHRWLRQAGFAVTTGDFTSLESGQQFDLLDHTAAIGMEGIKFRHKAGDQSFESNLFSLAGDPIPNRLQDIIPLILEPWIHAPICTALQHKLEQMSVEPTSKRSDA